MTLPALSAGGAGRGSHSGRMERIRERLTATSEGDPALRVMLVLAHELERYRALTAALEAERIEPAPSVIRTARASGDYSELVARVHELVTTMIPVNARVLVISRGDDALLPSGFEAAHFPQSPAGGYAGYYPADSACAVAELDRSRAAGAQYLVVPATSFWWLDFYTGLAHALLARGRVIHHDADCLIFALNNEP